jgi:hypothetical protein
MIALIALAAAVQATAVQDTSRHVAWGGFIDTYYAWDGGHPGSIDRPFTTQAARHNEFNINLAHVAVTLSGDRVRGRLALQAGTSVQSNYAGEPSVGTLSGNSLSRHIQEATVGARIATGLWADAGIYFSYIGGEGWISRDNATYTRSLVAEYSPYYLSGARLTWQPRRSPFTFQLHVMNGWQNISETNSDKAVGGRVDWQVSPALTLSYGNFFGNELPDSVPASTRAFNQVLAKLSLPAGLVVQGQFDYGKQGGSVWFGWTLTGRKPVTPAVAVAARLEQYSDPDQVIVVTGTPNPLKTVGGSLGLDVGRTDGLLWRTEVRGLRASAPLFPSGGAANGSRNSLLVVTSMALSL